MLMVWHQQRSASPQNGTDVPRREQLAWGSLECHQHRQRQNRLITITNPQIDKAGPRDGVANHN